MSFYERVQKGLLVGPSFTQGPKGWRVSSGSQGLKTSEREGETQRQKRRNRDGQRWVAWQVGRRQKTFYKREKKAQGLVEAVILRFPTRQVQAANEEAEGSRADEGLEVSEKSAVCLPQEKTLTKVSFVPISDLHKYIQQEEERRKGWKRMRARALEKGQPTEGTSWGHWCLLECKVSLWCLARCTVHVED